jgi:TolB-like protein
VEKTLAGEGEDLKEYRIGTEVYGRGSAYDPRADGIVRVEATRLRAKLREYYEGPGREDPVRIDVPKGSYAAVFSDRVEAAAEPAPAPRPSRKRRWWAAAAAAVVLVAGGWGWWQRAGRREARLIRSVTVREFKNLSGDAEGQPLAAGLSQELTQSLAGVQGLTVGGRDAQAVLEGSVRRSGSRVRVTAQLTDAADGKTLWARTYDREVRDLFQLQSELAGTITGSLARALRPRGLPVTTSPREPEANRLVNVGRQLYHKATVEDALRSIESFELAIKVYPEYARAQVGLADSYLFLARYGDSARTAEWLSLSEKAGRRALELAPEMPSARASAAYYACLTGADRSTVEGLFQEAIKRAPEYTLPRRMAAECALYRGDPERALAEIQTVLERVSSVALIWVEGARLSWAARRTDEAIERARRAVELAGPGRGSSMALGLALEQKREYAEAEKQLRKAQEFGPADPALVAALGHLYGRMGKGAEAQRMLALLDQPPLAALTRPWSKAVIQAGLGNRSQALALLESAATSRMFGLPGALGDPRFDPLREAPEFAALQRKSRSSDRP